jgi:transposase, IS30 family
MVSIYARPPEVEDPLIPGHWEGDLIKGGGNRSAVGTLVERASWFVLVVGMTSSTAAVAVTGFSREFAEVPSLMKKTMTYDRGKEMSQHRLLTEITGISIYLADSLARGNEYQRKHQRAFAPVFTKRSRSFHLLPDDLGAIAEKLNCSPRKVLGFRSTLEVYRDLMVQEMDRMKDFTTTSALST